MKTSIRLALLLLCLMVCSSLMSYYYGQNKINSTYTKWSQIETMHFDIYFPAGDDNFGRLVALMAEEAYYYLKSDFQFPAMSRIPIVFYGSQLEFQTTNIIYPLLSEGIGGFTESQKNRIAIPFDGNYSKLEQTLTHELTHAYINALDTGTPGSFFYMRSFNFPFWFSEGLPEFQAVGGANALNNSYILDVIINDRIRTLQETSGYNAYRLGESFLIFLNKRYGREKIMDFFYTLRALNDIDKASSKVFGLKFMDLESRWKNQLKRDYYPYISSHSIPNEYADQKTFHKVDASTFNLAPRFAPDGSKYVYFSNRDARFSVWAGGILDSSKNRRIILGEATGKIEEFHYLRSTLSWFSDSNRFAFVGKTSFGDRIYIADYEKEKIYEQITIKDLKAIYEIDVSPDGKTCVLAGQIGMQSDLFIYEFTTQELIRLTNDNYYEALPRFSPDGKSIAFASERTRVDESFRNGFFSDLHSNIYVINSADKTTFQVTFDDFNNYHPVWDSTGTKLMFISEKDVVPNVEIIDLKDYQRAQVTNAVSGVYGFDISSNSNFLVFSCYYNGGWNIYLKTDFKSNLEYADYQMPILIEQNDKLWSSIDLSKLDYYGKRKSHRIVTDGGPRTPMKNSTVIRIKPESDSTFVRRDFSWDNRPDSISVFPKIKPFSVRFTLDRLWGGFAYSTSVGAIGSLELGLSDVLGNHGIGINLGIAGKFSDSNFLLTYLYLPHRIDYGVGVYNILDEIIYQVGRDDYFRYRDRETGLYLLTRYPVNKFFRLDFENQVYKWEQHIDTWVHGVEEDYWENDFYHNSYKAPRKDIVYAPALTFVHDNALYGPTGPLLGWRGFLTLRKSFAVNKNDYQTMYADVRSYVLFKKRYSLATRLVGGSSSGKQPQNFGLDGYYGIRGYDKDNVGTKITMASAEIRYPFLDYFAMAFPLPLVMTSIRGSFFADLGGIWDNNSDFRGYKKNKLEDLYLGFGYGPRINIGFTVLKLDFAWLTDFVSISKPSYYLSLTEDF